MDRKQTSRPTPTGRSSTHHHVATPHAARRYQTPEEAQASPPTRHPRPLSQPRLSAPPRVNGGETPSVQPLRGVDPHMPIL